MSARLIIDQPFIERTIVRKYDPGLIVATAGTTEPLYSHRADMALECGVAATGDTVVFAGIIRRDNVEALADMVARADRLQIVGHTAVTNRLTRNSKAIYEQGLHGGSSQGSINTDLELLFLAQMEQKLNLHASTTAREVKIALAEYYRAFRIERRERISHILAEAILQRNLDR